MDFIPRNPSSCSFHTLGSFLPPQYPALKMTAPLNLLISSQASIWQVKVNNGNTKMMCEICSKLITKTLETRH